MCCRMFLLLPAISSHQLFDNGIIEIVCGWEVACCFHRVRKPYKCWCCCCIRNLPVLMKSDFAYRPLSVLKNMFLTSTVTIRASRYALHLLERIMYSLNVLLFKKKININQQLTTLPGIFLMINGDHLINDQPLQCTYGQTLFFLFIENKLVNDTLWLIWCFATGSCCRVELSDLTALKPCFSINQFL